MKAVCSEKCVEEAKGMLLEKIDDVRVPGVNTVYICEYAYLQSFHCALLRCCRFNDEEIGIE